MNYKVRLIVAGSRTFTNVTLFGQLLSQLLTKWKKEDVLLITGMAKDGADSMVVPFAKEHGYAWKEMPADWIKFHRAAGMIRNAEMADFATEGEYEVAALMVFWDGISPGTANMLENAQKREMERYVVFFDAVEDEEQVAYYPVMSAEKVENNRIVGGHSIFREEARYIARLLGYKTYPPDRTTFPYERMEEVIRIARADYAANRIPLESTDVLIEFLKFVGDNMLYVTCERLPWRCVAFSDEPTFDPAHGQGMNPNLH
jgi:hypothetical protein